MSRHREARYCQQWDVAPTRCLQDGAKLDFRSQCGYPSAWKVTVTTPAAAVSDHTCDVHLSQCVRRLTTEHADPVAQITEYIRED